jgi:hypothetical protein
MLHSSEPAADLARPEIRKPVNTMDIILVFLSVLLVMFTLYSLSTLVNSSNIFILPHFLKGRHIFSKALQL